LLFLTYKVRSLGDLTPAWLPYHTGTAEPARTCLVGLRQSLVRCFRQFIQSTTRHSQRIRLDRESEANHDLNRLLDEPGP
jgi:hypothetical protein